MNPPPQLALPVHNGPVQLPQWRSSEADPSEFQHTYAIAQLFCDHTQQFSVDFKARGGEQSTDTPTTHGPAHTHTVYSMGRLPPAAKANTPPKPQNPRLHCRRAYLGSCSREEATLSQTEQNSVSRGKQRKQTDSGGTEGVNGWRSETEP